MLNLSTGFRSRIIGPESFDSIFRYSVMRLYTGAQPASADAAVTGTLLAEVTRDGGAFTHGFATNSLEWVRTGIYALKNPAHTWTMTGIATGVAGWLRLSGNALDDGSPSLILPRLDCAVSLAGGGGEVILAPLTITVSEQRPFDGFWYAIPPIPEA